MKKKTNKRRLATKKVGQQFKVEKRDLRNKSCVGFEKRPKKL